MEALPGFAAVADAEEALCAALDQGGLVNAAFAVVAGAREVDRLAGGRGRLEDRRRGDGGGTGRGKQGTAFDQHGCLLQIFRTDVDRRMAHRADVHSSTAIRENTVVVVPMA